VPPFNQSDSMPTPQQVDDLLALLETGAALTVIETHEEPRLMALLEAGLETRFAEYRAAAAATRAGLRALEFPMFAPDACASPLVTAFCMRPGVDANDLQQALVRDSGVMISGGLTDLHGKILRVGHIGLARQRDYVVSFLLGVEDYLRKQGLAVAPGQSLIAVAQLK